MKTLRHYISALVLGIMLVGAGQSLWAADKTAVKNGDKADKKSDIKRILLITESRGYRHGCVTRNAELLVTVDPQNPPKVKDFDFEVVKQKDGKTVVKAWYLGRVNTTKPFEIR